MKIITTINGLKLKKIKKILYYGICAVCICLISMMIFTAFDTKNESINNDTEREYVFVIDPGHGGKDGGASSADGILEKDINLGIALTLNELLTSTGYKTVMTRTEDISIHDQTATTTREQKVSDMHNRLAIYNSSVYNIVVGIHQNKFENSKYFGAQIFYSPNNDKSCILAECVRNSIVSLLQNDNTRELKKGDANIYLLNNATTPAIITECGFLSNPDEASKLNDEEYRNKMAYSIYCGLLDYYNKELKMGS